MGIIDVGDMYMEMVTTMRCNFPGKTAAQRYRLAKKQFLGSVADMIEQNKKELIVEVNNDMNEVNYGKFM